MRRTDLLFERLAVLLAHDSDGPVPAAPPAPDEDRVWDAVGDLLGSESATPLNLVGALGVAVGEEAVRPAWARLDAHLATVRAEHGHDAALAAEGAAIALEAAALHWGARFGYALALSRLESRPTDDAGVLKRAFAAWWRQAHAAATPPASVAAQEGQR